MGDKIRAIIFLCIIFLFSGVSCIGVQAEEVIELLDDDGCIKMGNGSVVAQARFGYKGKCKYGRNLRADVLLEARKNDYSGFLRVEYRVPWSGNSVMVQKNVAVNKGEESKIQLALPQLPYVEDMEIKVSLCDEDGEELCSKCFSIYPFGDNISPVFTGILSDSQDKMGYFIKYISPGRGNLPDDKGHICSLLAEDITDDARMLSTLDVIIIDNFNTKSLSDGQTEAIKEWVAEGGTLILGGGILANEVLGAFAGDIVEIQTGKTRKINTDFGVTEKELVKLNGKVTYNKKIPLDITRAVIKNAKTVLSDGNKELISKVKYKKGCVLVSRFSFAFEEETASIYGAFIADFVINNLSIQRKNIMGLSQNRQQTINVYNRNGYSYKGITMLLNETDAIPNIKLYAVIMLIYVILAGPVSYKAAKRRDKRQWLWIIVPSFSVIFSIVIYLVGTSTRIQEPFINYASEIELPAKGGKANNANTTFAITSPFSNPYEVQLPKNTNVLPAIIDAGVYYMPGGLEDGNRIICGTEEMDKSSKLLINDVPSFESAYFNMENKTTSKGTVQIKIKEESGKVSGTVNNKMSCNLENCLLFHNGNIYYIGNLLAGETVNLSGTSIYSIFPDKSKDLDKTADYEYSLDGLLEEIMDAPLDSNDTGNDLKRRICMILDFANSNKAGNAWFYGFVQYGSETGFANHFIYNSYGETGVYKYLN